MTDVIETIKLKSAKSVNITMEIDCSLKVNRPCDHQTRFSLSAVVGFDQTGGHQTMTRAMTQTSRGKIRMLS